MADWTPEQWAAIRRIARERPPLTDEQRRRLRPLMAGGIPVQSLETDASTKAAQAAPTAA